MCVCHANFYHFWRLYSGYSILYLILIKKTHFSYTFKQYLTILKVKPFYTLVMFKTKRPFFNVFWFNSVKLVTGIWAMLSRWKYFTNTVHAGAFTQALAHYELGYYSQRYLWFDKCTALPALTGLLLNSNWLRQPLYWPFSRGAILSSITGCERKRWILKERGKDNAGDRGWLKADRTTQWRGNRQLTRLQPSEQIEGYRPRSEIDRH